MSPILATWVKRTSAPQLQRSSHIVSVVDNTAYIFGGELIPRQPRDNDVHSVSLDSSATSHVESTQSQSGPSPRVGTASTVLNNKIYIFSGRGGEAMSPVDEHGHLWEYDPTNSTWTSLAPSNGAAFPELRSYHTLTSSPKEEKIYLHAGCPTKGRLNDLWSFHVPTKEWKELKSAPGSPRGGTSIASVGSKLYRMGGFDGEKEVGGALDVYDSATNEWSTIQYAPDAHAGPGARSVAALLPVSIGGKQYLVSIFGESDPSSLGHLGAGNMLGDAWAWSLESETWQQVNAEGEWPAPRGWFDADVVRGENGRESVIVVGGLAEGNERLSDVWELSF